MQCIDHFTKNNLYYYRSQWIHIQSSALPHLSCFNNLSDCAIAYQPSSAKSKNATTLHLFSHIIEWCFCLCSPALLWFGGGLHWKLSLQNYPVKSLCALCNICVGISPVSSRYGNENFGDLNGENVTDGVMQGICPAEGVMAACPCRCVLIS